MRFLLEQDVYPVTARFLISLGHDVVTASDLGLARASDARILDAARTQERVLVTRDRHFGSLVYLAKLGPGVVYLRMVPSATAEVHEELARVLDAHSDEELVDAFVVVERGRHRFRRLVP